MRLRTILRIAVPSAAAAAALFLRLPNSTSDAQTTVGPTFSSPIALDPSEGAILAVNPDNDTVAFIPVASPNDSHATEFHVGREPQSLAIKNDGSKVYVSNTADGTVTAARVSDGVTITTIRVGTEPWGIALTPNGKKLYVANSGSNSLSVIDTATDTVIKTIFRVGVQPRGLAITSDGDSDDNDEKVYVTNFLAQYRAGDIRPGSDDGKVGLVSVVSTATDTLTKTVQLNPIADTGFKSNGDALNKIAPVAADSCTPSPACTFTITTGAFPNILASAAIKNGRLYVPATGSSPNGPVRFNVILQSLVAVVDTTTDVDLGKTKNLNNGIQFEADANDLQVRPLKRFLTNPYYIAFRHSQNSGYIVSAASDQVLRMDLAADGSATINPPAAAGGASGIKRMLVGKNPRAMIIDRSDRFGYVWNYVSRDVSVLDLDTETVVKRFFIADQPVFAPQIAIQKGKELFNTSIGPFFPVSGVLEGAMADRGWCACASCHPNGLTDGVAWMFPSGPRISTPLNSTFARDGSGQRALNWSAIFDEVADFELNTRNVAGGSGLIRLGDGTPDPNVNAFTVPSAGRNADRDSITEYLKHGIRSPISPVPADDLRAAEGRKVFIKVGCATCHSGPNWTTSRVEFPPPPPASALVAEQGTSQLIGQLRQVGTFNAAKPFELIGTGGNISKQALGASGYNVPSLRGIHALGPYLHNGTAITLEEILDTPAHVGTSRLLDTPGKRKNLVRFLQSIDDGTQTVTLSGVEREEQSVREK